MTGAVSSGNQAILDPNDPPGVGLFNPRGVAVSPDGANVYVAAPTPAARGNGAVTAFERTAATGALTQIQCRARQSPAPNTGICQAAVGNAGIQGAYHVAVSPDGAFAYVAARSGGTVAGFARAQAGPQAGQLTSQTNPACLGNQGGCLATPGLSGATALAFSPDGAHLYVADWRGGIAVLARNQATGALSFRQCVRDR